MKNFNSFAPRLLAGFGTAALVASVGFFASSRPAHTAGGPIPVTVANVPLTVTPTEGEPVETFILISTSDSFSGDKLVYTVPASKRLVVQSMTLASAEGDSGGYTGLVLNETSGTGFSVVSIASLTAGPGTGAGSATTQPMHLHVGPSGKVVVEVTRAGGGAIGNLAVSLSGYLVDAP